jgi:hypothetical protein
MCSWIGRINAMKIAVNQKQSRDSVQFPSKVNAILNRNRKTNPKISMEE